MVAGWRHRTTGTHRFSYLRYTGLRRLVWSKISTPNPLSAVPSPAQAPSAPAISGPPLSIPPSETVDGKQILSARRLRDLFPFGYYVFSKKEGQWTYEATPEANRLQYHIDPKRVQIEPDFAKKTVHWKILLSAEAPNGQAFALQDNLVELTVPMTTRRGQSGEIVHPVFLLPFFYQENQPSPFVVTLDDDQRFPVFTLGFRIPDKESTQLSPTPNTAASPP
jgi:hypothetical protein